MQAAFMRLGRRDNLSCPHVTCTIFIHRYLVTHLISLFKIYLEVLVAIHIYTGSSPWKLRNAWFRFPYHSFCIIGPELHNKSVHIRDVMPEVKTERLISTHHCADQLDFVAHLYTELLVVPCHVMTYIKKGMLYCVPNLSHDSHYQKL